MAQLALADALIAPSRSIARDFVAAGADPLRIEIVSSGIDLTSIPPRLREPGGTIRVICAAYLGEHKGIQVLIEALKILWADRPVRGKWRLAIAGDGPLRVKLRDLVRDEDMAAFVEAPGRLPRKSLLERLGQADAALLPSICVENQPVWLLEGLASGAALIASRVEGNVDVVEHGVNGLLYDRADPTDLAAALSKLIHAPELVVAYSAENLRRRQRFDEAAAETALDSIYRSKPRRKASGESVLACGLSADAATVTSAVGSVPESLDGSRIRLVWWRWPLAGRKGARLWIFSLRSRPMDWVRTVRLWGLAPVFARLRAGRATGWRERIGG